MSWSRPFKDPITLLDGRTLSTLREAGEYIKPAEGRAGSQGMADRDRLPDRKGRDFVMHSRIGVLRALNRNVERTFNLSRKDTHWGQRTLKRDQ